jgi:hypothetical protein
MDFAKMLAGVKVPESLHNSPPREPRKPTRAQMEAWARNTKAANAAKVQASMDRYRAAMRDQWLSQGQIEDRLGLSRCVSSPLLHRWWKAGLMERKWVNKKSSVWRWK